MIVLELLVYLILWYPSYILILEGGKNGDFHGALISHNISESGSLVEEISSVIV